MTLITARTMIQYTGMCIKGVCLTCLIPPTSLCLACCAAFTNTSVALFTALPAAYRIIVDVTLNSNSKHKKNPSLFGCL